MKIEVIKKYMKENKITYEELSQKSGLSISTIKKVFAGISPYPRLDTVQAIENALGLSDDITAEDIANGWVSTKKISISPKEEEMLIVFRELGDKLGEAAQDAAISFIKNMINFKV